MILTTFWICYKYFEIESRSLRGHKGVKGQIFKNAPIELKFIFINPYDQHFKHLKNTFEGIKGSQKGQRAS